MATLLEPITAMTCTDDPDKFRSKVPEKNMWYSQKLDGVRTLAVDDPLRGGVYYYSRNGKLFPNFRKFDHCLHNMAKVVRERSQLHITHPVWFDGEVISADQQFSGVMQQLSRMKDVDASVFQYHLFDLPNHPGFLDERLMNLDFLVTAYSFKTDIFLVPHFSAGSWSEVMRAYSDALYKGQEGIVVKNCKSTYVQRCSINWLKLKEEHTIDLPVIGSKRGRGKFSHTLGALVCDYNGKRVAVSGFTDWERNEFWENPPKMIEVQYQCITSQGSLRHPRYVRVREDK